MATVPEIRVFAMLPLDPANPEPFSDWLWVHCLTFPLDALDKLRFTSKPYKWIRYSIGVIIGAQGELSFSRNLPHEVLEYNDDIPSVGTTDLYYHTSDDEKRTMFPIDPNTGYTTVTSSDVTSRRENFRSDVAMRDARKCVLTSYNQNECDAVHLVPHVKGDLYIENYTRHRSRDPARNDIVRKIDDVRNGILLNRITHLNSGVHVAFLVTPNFAMNTTDVDPNAPPTEKRCTAHLFVPNKPEKFGDRTLRSGALVRTPTTHADKWPPNILFDAVYAGAILHHFAPQTVRNALEQWKSVCAAQASYQTILDDQTAETEPKNEDDWARDVRAARHADRESRAGANPNFIEHLLIVPYLLVPPDKREEVWKNAARKSAERERSRLEDKVLGWAREVADSTLSDSAHREEP